MLTTIDTITNSQIEELAHEAGSAGDERMRRICLAALGDESWAEAVDISIAAARRACVDVINAATAAKCD